MCFVYCLGIDEPAISDYNKRMILLYVIQLSGGHCSIKIMNLLEFLYNYG